jgi:hypothetical protein
MAYYDLQSAKNAAIRLHKKNVFNHEYLVVPGDDPGTFDVIHEDEYSNWCPGADILYVSSEELPKEPLPDFDDRYNYKPNMGVTL